MKTPCPNQVLRNGCPTAIGSISDLRAGDEYAQDGKGYVVEKVDRLGRTFWCRAAYPGEVNVSRFDEVSR